MEATERGADRHDLSDEGRGTARRPEADQAARAKAYLDLWEHLLVRTAVHGRLGPVAGA